LNPRRATIGDPAVEDTGSGPLRRKSGVVRLPRHAAGWTIQQGW